MSNLRYLTAGESHGKGLTTIIEGIPSNLKLTAEFINMELSRRQLGYGRGGRMKIEKDSVEILSGIRHGSTIGSPVTLFIENKDWENWKEVMSAELPHPLPNPPLEREGISPLLQGFIPGAVEGQGEGGIHSELRTPNSTPPHSPPLVKGGGGGVVTRPRPGHADLSGAIKYNQRDIRNILERSSARETAARVALGAVAKRLLGEFGIKIYSWVTEIGEARGQVPGVREEPASGSWRLEPVSSSIYYSSHSTPHTALSELFDKAEKSEVRCPVATLTEAIKKRIDAAREKGDSLGGVFEIVVSGVPAGLGSHVQWDRKLNARLAMSLMSIQAIKGVEIGLGFEAARRPGSEVHDEIFYSGQWSVVSGQEKEGDYPGGTGFQPVRNRQDACSTIYGTVPGKGFYRNTNNAGGIEGGMSNGEDIVLRAAMKPIPTLYKPLRSVDIETKEAFEASIERSDICAVPAASVVGEAVVAIEIANAMLDKFGGDSMEEVQRNYESYIEYVRGF